MSYEKNTSVMAEKLIYNIFRFLWIIVLLPKEGQFVVFAAVIIWWTISNRQFIKINRVTIWFLTYAGFHLISIIIAVIARDYALNRIAASLNTCGMWVIAVWIAGIVSQAENIDIDRIGKYCVINISIMFVLMAATWFMRSISLNMILETRSAWVWDLLSSGETTRFAGMLEYPTLVGVFTLLQFPWAFRYLSHTKHKWLSFGLIPVAFLPVFMTYARMGSFLMLIMIFAAVNYFMLDNGVRLKTLIMIYIAMAVLVIAVVLINIDSVATMAEAIFNARPGSNSDRMRIYTDTVNKISETSWIIGAGIKEMNAAGVYPLGSHCTYLGILYKAGILGGISAAIGFATAIIMIIRKSLKSKDCFALLIVCLTALLMLFFAVEDIDGADWLIVLAFTEVSLYLCPKFGRINI